MGVRLLGVLVGDDYMRYDEYERGVWLWVGGGWMDGQTRRFVTKKNTPINKIVLLYNNYDVQSTRKNRCYQPGCQISHVDDLSAMHDSSICVPYSDVKPSSIRPSNAKHETHAKYAISKI